MKRFTTLLLALICAVNIAPANTNLSGVPSDDPQVLANRVVDDLLSRKFMYYGRDGIHYTETCTAIGALRFAQETKNTDRLEKLIARYEIMLEDGNNLVCHKPHVDRKGRLREICIGTGQEDDIALYLNRPGRSTIITARHRSSGSSPNQCIEIPRCKRKAG